MIIYLDRQNRRVVNDIVGNVPLVLDRLYLNDNLRLSVQVLDPPYPYTIFRSNSYTLAVTVGTPGIRITDSVKLASCTLTYNANSYNGTLYLGGAAISAFLGTDIAKKCYLEIEMINSTKQTNYTIYQEETTLYADILK